MASPHRIRRLRLQLRTASPAEGLALRRRARALVDEALVPALERAFDDLVPGDEVLHLERLELRVRAGDLERIAELLPELIRREIGERGAVRGAPAGVVQADHDNTDIGELDARSEQGPRRGTAIDRDPAEVKSDIARTTISVESHRLRALVHYLQTGSLPWDVAGLDETALRAALQPTPLDEIVRLLVATAADAGARMWTAICFRLLQLLPERDWPVAAAALVRGEVGGDVVVDALAALVTADVGRITNRYVRLRLAATVIALGRLPLPRARAGASAVVANAAAAVASEAAAVAREVLALYEHEQTSTAEIPAAPSAVAWLRHRLAAVGDNTSRAVPPGEPTQRVTIAALPPPRSAAPLDTRAGDEPLGTPIANAGLILLHPFLPRLFEHTEIRRADQREIDEAALPRAAALLHLCATGDEEPHEYELDLIKILLGLEADAPLLVAGGLLRPSDVEEVDDLLRAAIDHWSALKNTSPAGLRATFLGRRGLVREVDRGYLLRVEPAGFDVLLAQLPWGFSTVKLPWMKQAIFTEWPTP